MGNVHASGGSTVGKGFERTDAFILCSLMMRYAQAGDERSRAAYHWYCNMIAVIC
jgi:hypothetical protein